jgi:uncharacterized protein (TIGR02466 family)|tara:strand:+ start:1157 stop:1786 length:630 start_codon:yes stop_codon:yes gene_type:complete
MTGVPLFPTGLVKQYHTPKPFMDNLDLSKFTFEKFKGQTKLRTEKFNNILLQPEFKEIRVWVENCAKDFLDNVLQMEYEEFFLTESWLNISGKGGYQKVHNHSNSIISGTLYLKSEENHPPLEFKKQKMEFEPFISLTEHYKKGNPNTANTLAFPCTQNSMFVFNSYLYHGHGASQIESERIGLAWNGLVNFVEKDKDIYRIKFVKEET